jgi:hypothetical protein
MGSGEKVLDPAYDTAKENFLKYNAQLHQLKAALAKSDRTDAWKKNAGTELDGTWWLIFSRLSSLCMLFLSHLLAVAVTRAL